jgi:serine/threonine protein kinase
LQNNILIDDDGHAVICDFGLSNVLDELVATSSVLACSVRWQAPELIFDEDMNDGDDDGEEEHPPSKLSPASDVWAFGCAAYEVCVSFFLREGKNIALFIYFVFSFWRGTYRTSIDGMIGSSFKIS